MAQAHVNPEELREFAQALKAFNQQANDLLVNMNARFNRLGQSWKDPQQQRFANEFAVTTRTLRQFIQISEQHIPLLNKQAQHISDYLNER